MTEQTTETLPEGTDNFAAAFDKLAEMANETPPDTVPEPETGAEAAAEPAEPAAEAAAEPAEPAAEAAAEPAEPAAEAPAEPEAKPDDDILSRFANLMKQAQAQQEPQPQPQQHYQQPTEQPPMFSPEEEKLLENYEKDWPDVAKAEAIRRRAEYKELVGYVFSEVAKEIMPALQTLQALSERTHLNDLHNTINDYDEVRDRVIEWAGKQPPYLRAAYNHVIQQGTVDEVADLIERYRAETGVKLAAPPQKKVETELPAATKQAAASLAPVSSKRSAVPRTVDPQDFESAFAAFAEKL